MLITVLNMINIYVSRWLQFSESHLTVKRGTVLHDGNLEIPGDRNGNVRRGGLEDYVG